MECGVLPKLWLWKRAWSQVPVGLNKIESLCFCPLLVREQLKELTKQYEKSENDLKALQSVGQVSKKKEVMASCSSGWR